MQGCAVVLVRVQGAVNLGMVARLCGNLAIDDLRLVDPLCHTDDPEALRFATSAAGRLAQARIFPDLLAATADRQRVVGTSGDLRIAEAGGPLRAEQLADHLERRGVQRWALVFGNEADGLSADELSACQDWVHLPTYGPVTSYNLAMAVAILASVVARRPPDPPQPSSAERGAIERLQRIWLPVLEACGVVPPARRRAALAAWRRLVDRLQLDDDAVARLSGLGTRLDQRLQPRTSTASDPPCSTR